MLKLGSHKVIFLQAWALCLGLAAAHNDDNTSDVHYSGNSTEGFEYDGSLHLPLTYSHSIAQAGVADGNYFQAAGRFKNSLHFAHLEHDWNSSLLIAESFGMSPAIKDRWIKLKDILLFKTGYLYNFAKNAGFFANARLQSSIFTSSDINGQEKTYDIYDPDGKKIETKKSKEIHLSNPFMPLFIGQHLGVFVTPVREYTFTWETRAAAGFREVISSGQKIVADTSNDPIIEINELRSHYQIGPSIGTSISGKLHENKIKYSAGIDAMWPLWQSPPLKKDRKFTESLNIEANADLSYKINDNFLVRYEYTAQRLPGQLTKWQQEHLVNLIINIDWQYKF